VVTALSFQEARAVVLRQVREQQFTPIVEVVGLEDAFGRVLARDVCADRDYPPVARSVRDGFALRAEDLPGEFEVIGEVRAGESSALHVGPGQAVEIMTGAPIPAGADAVVMVEHTAREGGRMRTERTAKPGEFINPAGSEASAGRAVVTHGSSLTQTRIAMLATVGCLRVPVYRRPTVAILSTGDEVVDATETPLEFQVRNSNAWALAAQVKRAGGEPRGLPIARDVYAHTRELVEQGLREDLLLLSGGVSAGKYDLVEQVLADLGAEFFFTRVLIQPGQPLVFGRVQNRFFFGLPGNPGSAMVTFEIFARAAVELLSGIAEPLLPFLSARLTKDFRHKLGLTRFLPAVVSADGSQVTPEPWQGSSDVPAMARANAFLVVDAQRDFWPAGEWMPVLLQ
jgi:molybdopterin molybdotransferase